MGVQDVARAGQRASRSEWIDRAARAGLVAYGVMHLLIAFLAFRIAFGVSGLRVAAGGSSHSHTRSWTARLMDLPAGQVLVGLVGLGIAVYGGVMVWRGATGRMAEKLDAEGRSGESGRAYLFLGAAGSVAKGIAFLVVASLFCYAAVTHDPHKSGGLDIALHKVVQQPFGPWLLALVALGIGCYGLFSLVRARHLSR